MRRSSALLLLLAASSMALHAQQEPSPSMLVGPYIELGGALDAASVPVFGGFPECGAFESGTAVMASVGGRVLLPSLLSRSLGAGLDLGIGRSVGSLTTRPADPQRFYEAESGRLVELDEHYDLQSSWWEIALRPMLTLNLSDRLSLHGGPNVIYRMGHTFTAIDRIDGPGDYRHQDGSREKGLTGATALTPAGVSIGGSIGIAMSIPMASSLILQPRFDLGYQGGSPVESYGWSRLQATVGMGLLFGTGEAAIALEPPPATPPSLTAGLEIIGLDAGGNRLSMPEVFIEDRVFRRHAPLLPAVFFDRDSAMVSDRYMDTTSSAAGGSDRRIVDRSLLALQRELPSIIARRMRQRSASRLELYGSVSSDEDPSLALARAAELKDLLVETHGIDPDRITDGSGNPVLKRSSEATVQGREDNRRVELVSDDPSILAPLVLERPERLFDPPAIVVEPRMRSAAGIRSWEVAVSQGGREVARFGESGDRPMSPEPEFTWRIDEDRIDSTLAPLIAILTVIDSTGARAVDTVVTPLRLRQRRSVINADITRIGERERLEWTLIGFDFNEALPRERDRRTIDQIADLIRPGAEIRITGTADIIGSEATNADLAVRRASEAARLLRARLATRGITAPSITIGGVGEEAKRFGAQWPEARMLSRGIELVVEQEGE